MPPIILAFNAALLLAEKLLPLIDAQLKRGEISLADQQTARDRYTALRSVGDTAFLGPQWTPSTAPTPIV